MRVSTWTLAREALSRVASRDATSVTGSSERETDPEAQAASDLRVIQRVQLGDKQALSLLYDRYAGIVLGVGLRILRDSSEAQELVQDVFLYVFRKSQDFNPSKSCLRTWLLQIAYSRAFNKREYLALRRFYDYRHIDEVLDSVACDCSPERDGQTSELRELLRDAFNELTEAQRKTLEMFFWEGYSLREISIRLTDTLGNTRNHYYRGLEKLRAKIKLSSRHLHNNGGR
jgi:RNA polymerase sigma-70 factor (ECF subfamily)